MRRAGHIEDYETEEEEGEEDGRFGRKASWRIVAGKSLLVRASMQAVEVWMSTWGLREMPSRIDWRPAWSIALNASAVIAPTPPAAVTLALK